MIMMTEKPPPEEIEEVENINVQRLAAFMQSYSRTVFYGVCAFVALIVATSILIHYQQSRAEVDYLTAAFDYHNVTTSPQGNEKALERLQEILARHNDLSERYNGSLAQSLISQNQGSLATKFGHAAITSLPQNFETIQSFSNATLHICKDEYSEALNAALQLQENLEGTNHKPCLAAFNLIRIATLHKRMEAPIKEKEAWGQFKNLATQIDPQWQQSGSTSKSTEAQQLRKLVQSFKLGNVTLMDYIQARSSEQQS